MLLDLLMSEPDGFDVLHRIREDPGLADVPVVVMTGEGPDAVRLREAQRVGAADPPKGADLTRLVRETLNTIASRRERLWLEFWSPKIRPTSVP